MRDEYRYILRYVDGNKELIASFSATCNIDTLREELKSFLLGAGWLESQVADIFNEEHNDTSAEEENPYEKGPF